MSRWRRFLVRFRCRHHWHMVDDGPRFLIIDWWCCWCGAEKEGWPQDYGPCVLELSVN